MRKLITIAISLTMVTAHAQLPDGSFLKDVIQIEKGGIFQGYAWNAPHEAFEGMDSLDGHQYAHTIGLSHHEFRVLYLLDSIGLYEVNVASTIEDGTMLNMLLTEIVSYYTGRDSPPRVSDDGFYVWDIFDEETRIDHQIALLIPNGEYATQFLLKYYVIWEDSHGLPEDKH